MGLFDHFPYTNFHELNLTWILNALKQIQTTMDQFVAINALKYADPIQWNIVSQYEKNTIVIDPLTGTAYISVQPVPSGVIITNTDYWSVVFDLGSFVVRAAKNFTDKYEDETTLTATFPSNVNDWLIWGDTLYLVISPIVAGDQYVDGSNIVHFTAEDVIGHIQELNTTDKSNLVAAVNELVQALIDEATRVDGITGDLDDLNTTDKSNLVAAINELVQALIDEATRVDGITGDLDDLNTTDKSNLVAAINEVLDNRAWISSKDFKLVGDGVTDDRAAFIQMLEYAQTSNKSIKLESNKVFALSDSIHIPSYTYIDGSNSTILWLSENNVGFYCHGEYQSSDGINPSPESEQATAYNGHHDIIIKNLIFDSNNPTVQRSCSIVTFHSSNVLIENCVFKNDTYNHAIEVNASKNVTIKGCSFKNNIAGSDVTRTEINIDIAASSGIPGFGSNSASYDYTICKDLSIIDCYFDRVMSCFDSHGTYEVDNAILTPVDGIIINNILVRDSEIITTIQSWTNFMISNILAKGLLGSYDNSFIRLRNARSGSIKNITIEHPINVLGTNANIIVIGSSTIGGITERSHDVTIDNLTALCEETDLFRLLYLRGATNCNFNNLFIAKTGTTYLISTDPSEASYNIEINNIISNQKCNGLINNLSNSSIVIKNSYLANNTEIGINNGNLKIIDSRFSNLSITDNNVYIASNVQLNNHKSDNVIIDTAYNAGAAVTAGSYADVTVTFNESSFYVPPRVLVSPFGNNRQGMRYSVATITTSGFTVRCYNESAGDYSDCPFIWLAIRDSSDT